MSLSQGPYGYNRFQSLDDLYLEEKVYWTKRLQEKKADKDYDGDGKVESGKDEYFGSKDKAIKKAKGEESKEKCECTQEDFDNWIHSLVAEGYDLSDYTVEEMIDIFFAEGMPSSIASGKFGAAPKVKTPASISSGKFGAAPKVKPTGSLTSGKFGPAVKEDVTADDVCNYLIEKGYVNNEVSAEVFINNMSDAWLSEVIDACVED